MSTATAEKVQISETEIKQLTAAKQRLAAKTKRLQAMLARAKAAGNTRLVTEIEAELKEAASYRARIASIETTIKPFLQAYESARQWVSDLFSSTLGGLAALPLIPAAAAAGIAAVVYAINVWDRKTETSLQRYEAELKAHDEWVKRGKTASEATALVKSTADAIAKENTAEAGKKSLLDELQGYVKLAGLGLLLWGGYQLYSNSQKSKTRAA